MAADWLFLGGGELDPLVSGQAPRPRAFHGVGSQERLGGTTPYGRVSHNNL